jgi:hypothetical protein
MKTHIFSLIGLVLLLALILGMALEFKHLNRVLQMSTLLRNSAIVGFLAGLLAGALLSRKVPAQEDRPPAFFGILFLFILIGSYFGSLSNRLLADTNIQLVSVELQSESPYQQARFGLFKSQRNTPDGYRSFFFLDGQLYKIQAKKSLFKGIQAGQMSAIPIQHGFWGFRFVPDTPASNR